MKACILTIDTFQLLVLFWKALTLLFHIEVRRPGSFVTVVYSMTNYEKNLNMNKKQSYWKQDIRHGGKLKTMTNY